MTAPTSPAQSTTPEELDPRDPDYSRKGIFVYHNCWRCNSGEKPCVQGEPRNCTFPHAKDD